MKLKKTAVVILICSFAMSAVPTLGVGIAKTIGGKSKEEIRKTIDDSPALPTLAIPSLVYGQEGPKEGTIIFDSLRRTGSKDQYTINKQQFEQFIDDGYSVRDILLADELGNNTKKDPKSILEEKIRKDASWETMGIIDRVYARENLTTEFRHQFKEESKLMDEKEVPMDKQFQALLKLNNGNKAASLELVPELKNIKNRKSLNEIIDSQSIGELELKAENVSTISPEMLKQLEKISKKTNIPVTELIQKHNEHKVTERKGML